MPVYLTLQPIRCAAAAVTGNAGGLLHHLFTLAACLAPRGPALRRLFSVTLLSRCRLPAVNRYGALCCPDFPRAPYTWASDGPPVPGLSFLFAVIQTYPLIIPRLELRTNRIISSRSGVAGNSASIRLMASVTLSPERYR